MSFSIAPLWAQSGGNYEITKSTIDSGGGTVTGGNYILSGTIGQHDAETHAGGAYLLEGGFWQSTLISPPGCACLTVEDCRDNVCADDNGCNHVSCSSGTCVFTCVVYGDVQPPGGNDIVSLDDILCVLAGFAGYSLCPNADIHPCGGNSIISLDDILAVLGAFSGLNPCACTENSAPGTGLPALCGSSQP